MKKMPDFNSQITQINANRQTFDVLQQQLYSLRLREQKGEKVTNDIKKAQDQLAAAKTKLQGSIAELHQGQTQDTLVSNWDTDIPLLLMPVRIQTRIATTQNPSAPTPFELLIRIYPDDILMNTHEDVLTDLEIISGKKYWNRIRLSEQLNISKDQQLDMKKEAWRQLSGTFGGGRSLYISRKTTPLNRSKLGQLSKETDIQFDDNNLKQTKNRSWSEGAQTRLLPDRFQAIVFKNFEQGPLPFIVQNGNLIPDTLRIGIDPMNDNGNFKKQNDEIIVGTEVKWMTDFAEAERVGMGIRVAIPPTFFPSNISPQPQLRAAYLSRVGIPRVVVLGVLHSADKTLSQNLLEDLFDGHLYTRKSMSFLKKGTPTNNTDEKNSAWSHYDDPLSDNYFDGFKEYVESDSGSGTDGARLAQALGISKNAFLTTPNAGKLDISVEKLVNSTLYAATIGYFFDQLLAGVVTNKTELKTFFNGYVLSGGSMPSLRIGNQPYGVILAGEYAKFTQADTNATFYQSLIKILQTLDGIWQNLSNNTPRIGKGDDPAKTLTDVLSQHAHSVSFSQQWFYPVNLTDREVKDFVKSQTESRSLILEFLKSLGFQGTAAPFIGGVIQDRSKVNKPLNNDNLVKPDAFDDDDSLSSNDNFNYFEWLNNATIRDLETLPNGSRANVGSLLFMITRQAYLNLLANAVISFVKLPIFKQTESTKIVAIVRGMQTIMNLSNFNTVVGSAQTPTVWTFLNAVIQLDDQHPAIGAELAKKLNNKSIGDVIQSDVLITSILKNLLPQAATNVLLKNTLNPIIDFAGQRARLKFLANMPAATLERALISHLDAISYRLDAWQEGLLAKKLEQNRNKQGKNEGIYIGAYGWVEDLKFTPNNADNSGGVIHAPSVTHAVTASILKAAYINHKNTNGQSAFALNLHSKRVQRAQEVLEKMRAGERLEAILGYQFERDLQDFSIKNNNAAASFILNFRKTYPITALQLPTDSTAPAVEVVSTRNLTNGLAIAEEFLRTDISNASVLWRQKIGIAPTETAVNSIQTAVASSADTLDAVKDLLMAETAYRMAQGNFSAAGATLDGLKKGNVPHDLSFLRPARQNVLQFTNRVAIHFDTEGGASNFNSSPRASAEGGLNNWCGQLLGKMNGIGCTISHVLENGEESVVIKCTLNDLKIQPLDLVCLMRTPVELETRLIYFYRQKQNISDDIEVHVNFNNSGVTNVQPIASILPLAKLAYKILNSARPLTAQDYFPNGTVENASVIDTSEYRVRLDILIKNLINLITAVNDLPITKQVVLPENGGTVMRLRDVFAAIRQTKYDASVEDWLLPNYADATDLQDRLIQIAAYGIADAFPHYANAKNPTAILALLRQAEAIISTVERNLTEISTALSNLPDISQVATAHIDALLNIGKKVFSGSMPLLPRFKYLNTSQIDDSNNRIAELLKGATTDATPPQLKAEEWLQSAARVRPKLANWETLRFMSAADSDFNTDLSPVQIPTDALLQKQTDGTTKPIFTWLGAEYTEGVVARRDVVSVVTTGSMATKTNKQQTGILLDEWVETIPTDEELTALAFHFNQPNAEAPQALLLTVCQDAKWTWSSVLMSVLETLRRAKLRTVNIDTIEKAAKDASAPNTLRAIAQLLPMTVAPVNVQQHTFTLDYGMMDEKERQRMSTLTTDALGHYQIWQE